MANNIDSVVANIMKRIQKDVNEVLQKEVIPKTIELLESHALKDFYESYSPTMYKRNRSLLKDSTYDIQKFANGFKISSDYSYGNKNIFDIAEHGKEMGYWDEYSRDKNGLYDEYNRDSHFLSNAYKELKSGLAKNWIVSGLRSKGYDCR